MDITDITPEDRIRSIELTVSRANQALWTLEGHSSEDYVMIAGIITGIAGFLATVEDREMFADIIKVVVDDKDHGQYDLDNLIDIRDDAGILDFGEVDLTANDLDKIDLRDLYVWLYINPDTPGVYYVDAFKTPRYIQGIIMGCNACGVDFRTLYHGKPFTVDAIGNIKYYDIQGYPIENPPDMPKWLDLMAGTEYPEGYYSEGGSPEYSPEGYYSDGGSPEDSPWMRFNRKPRR